MMSAENDKKEHSLVNNIKNESIKMPITRLRDGSQGAHTKERLLSVATHLLITQGYHGTTMRDIAEQCGLSKSALYFYYASKDVLIKDLVDQAFDHFNNELMPILQRSEWSNQMRVEKFAKHLRKFLVEQENTHFIFLTALDLIHTKKAFKKRINEYMNLWLTLLQKLMEPFTADVDTLSKRLLNSLQGAIFSAYIYQDNAYIENVCYDMSFYLIATKHNLFLTDPLSSLICYKKIYYRKN